MGLQVLRPYIFLGMARNEVNLKEVKGIGISGRISVFAGPDKQVFLAEDDSHIEPLMSLATSLDGMFGFDELYFGCEVKLRNDFFARSLPINLVIVPICSETKVFVEAWGSSFLKVYRMLGGKWVFFYANPVNAEQRSVMNRVCKAKVDEVKGLSLCESLIIPKSEGSTHQSDALRASFREAKYQLEHAHMFINDELARMRSRMKTQAETARPLFDHRSEFVLSLLERELNVLQKAKMELDARVTSVQKAASILDEFESVKSIVEQTKEYAEFPAHLRNQLLRSNEIFRVEDAFVLEAHRSLKLSGSIPMVIQGFGYYIRLRKVFSGGRLIELPTTLGLRLGLLPILFQVIALSYVEERRSQFGSFRERLRKEIVNLSHKSSFYRRILDSGLDSIDVLLVDLIASEMGGPAYVYALARGFAYGLEGSENTPLLIQDRLQMLCLYLRASGFEIPPFVPYKAEEGTNIMDTKKLAEIISGIHASAGYSVETHNSITEEVKEALLEGKVVAAKPSVVTNALWKAVVEKKGYLNENAAFLSILEWAESLGSQDILK